MTKFIIFNVIGMNVIYNKLKNICRIWSEFYEINEDELINLLKPLSSSESALDNLMKLLMNKKKYTYF